MSHGYRYSQSAYRYNPNLRTVPRPCGVLNGVHLAPTDLEGSQSRGKPADPSKSRRVLVVSQPRQVVRAGRGLSPADQESQTDAHIVIAYAHTSAGR